MVFRQLKNGSAPDDANSVHVQPAKLGVKLACNCACPPYQSPNTADRHILGYDPAVRKVPIREWFAGRRNATGISQGPELRIIATGGPDGIELFSPSTMLLFNPRAVGSTSSAQKVTLTNTGSAALKIASIKPDGQFGMTTTCGKAVAAAANCTISVTFSPKTKGKLNGTVTLVDSASTKPQVIATQGRGTD